MKQKHVWIAIAFLLLALIAANIGYRKTKGSQKQNLTLETSLPPNNTPAPQIATTLEKEPEVTRDFPEDVFAELKAAATKRDMATLTRLRDGWIASCSEEELQELIALVDGISDRVWRGTMMEAIAGKWAQSDPTAAIDYMTTRVMRERRQIALKRIFEVLAKSDPAKAFALISDTSKAAGHPIIMRSSTEEVFEAWKERDAEAAFAALADMDISDLQESALNALCQAETKAEREALFEHIRSIDDTSLERDAWKQTVSHWAEQAPFDEVIDWIGTQTFEGNLASRLEREVAIQHAAEDPQAMANWLMERSDSDSLPGHAEAAVHFWAADQPNACGEWLHEIGLGPQTDRAVKAYANAIIDHDAPSAFAWAQSITNAEEQTRTLEEVSERFYRFNPKGFIETVSTSSLSEDRRTALVEKIKRQAGFR